MNNTVWIKDSVKALTRIRDAYENRTDMFRMDRNERTWPFADEILKEIKDRINSETLTNYPEMDSIYRKMSSYLGVDYDQVYFHSGSDLVIKSVFETYIAKGDKVLLQNPSYAMYHVYACMFEADICELDYNENLEFDIDAYREKISEFKPKMVVLENPSGYVGNSYPRDKIELVIQEAHKYGALILVDEAYIDYVDSSVLDLIPKYDNLIIVRTMSKAWGLAGMRVGYAVSNKTIIAELFKVMPMHELTAASIIAAEVMLEHMDEKPGYIEDVIKVREYFISELEKLGIDAVKSDTHFVTARLGRVVDADAFREESHKNRYYVSRPFGQEFLKEWVRIGLIPMDDMKGFVEFLKEYIQKGK